MPQYDPSLYIRDTMVKGCDIFQFKQGCNMSIRLIKKREYDIVRDDPVRPHIPIEDRVAIGNEVYVMENDKHIDAVLCVSYMNEVPEDEYRMKQLNQAAYQEGQRGNIAVFYTVWSNKKGMGREMVLQGIELLKKNKPHIKRFVTLSPITQMATNFHISNGAVLIGMKKGHVDGIQDVAGCQNFEYKESNKTTTKPVIKKPWWKRLLGR